MPKLPTYQDVANVAPARDPGVSAPISAFQSGAGAFAGEFAQGINFVADVVREEEKRIDNAAVNDARRELLEFETEQQEWLAKQKGENVFNAKIKLDKAVSERTAQINKRLKNDRQRLAFSEVEGNWRVGFNRSASRYIAAEMDSHYDNVDNKLIEVSTRAAQKSASMGDFDRVQQEWEDQEKVIAGLAERKGLDENQRKAILDSRKSEFHSGIVMQLMADDNDVLATDYFMANKSEIDTKSQLSLGKQLEAGNIRIIAQNFADEAETSGMSESEAIKKARKTLSGKEEEAVVLAVKERFKERQNIAADIGWDILAKTKSLETVPPDVLEKMDGKVRIALEKEAQNIAAGVGTKTDPNVYYDLQTMAVKQPEKFQSIDLRQFFDKLDQGDREHFIKMQRPDSIPDASTLTQQKSNMHDQMGWDPGDKEKKGIFDKAVDMAIDEEQRIKGAKLTMKERQEVIDRLVIDGEVVYGQWYRADPNKKLFQVIGTDDAKRFVPTISDSDRKALVDRFKARGIKPTDEQIMQAYRKWKGL